MTRAAIDSDGLYGDPKALAKSRSEGFLKVSQQPLHELWYAEYGNPDGQPVIFLHGGPGGGCLPHYARFFDPERYRILLFDQRGAGRSRPAASIEANTTHDLIHDINRLRDHFGITGPTHIFGGSWGSTLALCYAIAHPENVKSLVLRGIFLARKRDLDWFYQGDAAAPGDPMRMGAGRFYPDAWADYVSFIPPAERGDMVAAYHRRLTSDDAQLRRDAAREWAVWEGLCSFRTPDEAAIRKDFEDPDFAARFAGIENHYFMHGLFVSPDGLQGREQNHILDHLAAIVHIPTIIVHGRYDIVCPRDQADALMARWASLQADAERHPRLIITDAGHSAKEPETRVALRQAADAMLEIC